MGQLTSATKRGIRAASADLNKSGAPFAVTNARGDIASSYRVIFTRLDQIGYTEGFQKELRVMHVEIGAERTV